MALSARQLAAMAEMYRRGTLGDQRTAAYEEMVRRGAIQDRYASGRLGARMGVAGGAAGFLDTVERAVPGVSEAASGLNALGETAINAMTGKPMNLPQAFDHQRATQQGFVDEFKAGHPIMSNLATGAGYAGQAAAALGTAGASEAPLAASAARGAVAGGLKAFGSRVARNAVAGGVVGAVNGAAQPGTVQERLASASAAVPGGMVAGVAVPAVANAFRGAAGLVRATAPRVGAVVSKGADAASRLFTGKSAVDQARPIPPQVAAKGQAAALDYLTRLGVTPDQLRSSVSNAFGKPVTTAEAIGPTGISQATGLARRAGTTPQLADATMKARQGDRMNRILGDIQETTGVDPEAAKGNIDAIVQNGRNAAGPLFDAVRAQAGPVVSPDLDAILGTPAGKTAVARTVQDLQNARIDPRAHGFAFGPPRPPSPAPLPEASAGDVANALSDVREARSKPTGGLFRAIQQLGGMKLTDGAGNPLTTGPDVAPILSGLKVPGLVNNRSGMTPDYMAQALHDRGWFEPNIEDPSQAFEEALDAHVRGNPQFKPGVVAPDGAARAQAFDQEAQAAGVLDSDHPNIAARKLAAFRNGDAQERAAIQAEGSVDPFGQEFDRLSAPRVSVDGLTPHALDLVRQNLGDMVERDQFGRVLPDSQSRGNFNVNKVRGDLTDLLAGTTDEPGLIPGYRQALDTASDYLSVKGAFDRAQGRLFGTSGPANDPRNFHTYFTNLSPGEQDATRASVANDVFTKLNNGQLGPGSFNAPAVQQKLSTVFGPDQAQALIARMKVESDMSAAGARMTPNLNSTTGDVIGSQADQDGAQAALGFARAGVNAFSGKPLAAARNLAGGVAPFVSAARQPLGMASRNALGDLLYASPASSADALSGRVNAFAVRPPDQVIPRSVTMLQRELAIMHAAQAGQQGQPDQSDQPNQ